ncbi:hypothetical protein CSA37_02280 [Candidatus Fermentibacteria bacterium]|nr:MAG: hypothetical protein CSA37_02280 [Candidatus Fermentibacteria bacterium]
MKKLLSAAVFTVLLVFGCGEEQSVPADPLSLVPEDAMIVIVLNDPAGIVRNIDGYIEDGVPAMGASMLENRICSQLEIASLDSMPSRYGLDPFGKMVFFMDNTMSQSIIFAVSSPDLTSFMTLMEKFGAEFQADQAIDSNPVYSIENGDGTMFITGLNGVAVIATDRTELESIIGKLSAETAIEVDPASLYMKYNMAMIGPLVMGQMPMARMLMKQSVQEEPAVPLYLPEIMDVYMDGLEVFLSQTDMVEITLSIGAEDIILRKNVVFTEGSDLAAAVVPGQERNMLQMIPMGDLANIRFSVPEEMSYQIARAGTGIFASDVPEETIRFWASLASSGGTAVYSDAEYLHQVSAFNLPEEYTIQDVSEMYRDYFSYLIPAISRDEEFARYFSITDNGIVQIDGCDFYNISMEINEETSMQFNYWITVNERTLLLETGNSPDRLISVINGSYQPAEVAGTGPMAGEISLAGYMELITAFTPGVMDIPEINHDLIIRWDGDYGDGSVQSEIVMNGRDASAAGFALFEALSSSLNQN